VQELLDSLQRAEDIAKFLRQQTDFWMEQVTQIQQAHVQTASAPTRQANDEHQRAPSDLLTGDGTPATPLNVADQMAEIRRAQSEQWKRRQVNSGV
jgi:hypothetical protein